MRLDKVRAGEKIAVTEAQRRAAWVVVSGVKGAYRTTEALFTEEAEAEAFADRVRATNSIGSYWAKVLPPMEDAVQERQGIIDRLAWLREHPWASGTEGEADMLIDRLEGLECERG